MTRVKKFKKEEVTEDVKSTVTEEVNGEAIMKETC